eukprot:g28991.t1
MSHRGHAGCAIFLTSVATICTTQLTRSAQNQLHAPGFVQALALAPAGLVQCLFGTSPAQVCLLSRIFLHEPFTFWRLLAIAFAFGGVLALAAHSHFQGDSAMDVLLGTLCGLSAVVAAACYKVAFKVRLGTPPVYVVLGVVGTLGFVAARTEPGRANLLVGESGAEDPGLSRLAGLQLSGRHVIPCHEEHVPHGATVQHV